MKESIFYFFMQNFGVGKSTSIKMCNIIGVSYLKKAKLVSEFKKEQAFSYLQQNNYVIGFNLKNKELSTLIFYNTIGNIKGYKFKSFLPIRGQRNKTNGKTARKNAINLRKLIARKVSKTAKIT